MATLSQQTRITGTEINYYFICPRKLWLFSHEITMEHTSVKVEIGQEIHQSSFKREKKEFLIDDIKIDFVNSDAMLCIHETKASSREKEAARYQLLYYIYYLEQKGISGMKGIIHYPKEKAKEEIILDENARRELLEIIKQIKDIKALEIPPEAVLKGKCRKCSYYELCFC